MRGGQRLFGTFPRIHPFWEGDASLSSTLEVLNSIVHGYSDILSFFHVSENVAAVAQMTVAA